MKLRWKKRPKETGLAAVGAGQYRASVYHDGKEEYATVYPKGGNWRGPLLGWYYVVSFGDVYVNTHASLMQDETSAKEAAAKIVKENLKGK